LLVLPTNEADEWNCHPL